MLHNKLLTSITCRFGMTAFGYYTLGMELSVEVSFPIDQTFGTSLMFMSGQIQGGLLVLISEAMNQPLSSKYQGIQVSTWFKILW